MGIKIQMTNTKISDNAKIGSNMKVGGIKDINIKMDCVEIKDNAEFLNNLTDVEIDELLNQLKEYASLLKKTDYEYNKMADLFADIQKKKLSIREVLKQHLPNLLTGTLSNIIGNMVK